MHLKRGSIVLGAMCAIIFVGCQNSTHQPPAPAAAAPPDPRFTHPDQIRYDGQCLTINGKDTLIFSGSFHYFRCPKALWPERFQKIKDLHLNCVETYVAWNTAELTPPTDPSDFSHMDLSDFRDWLKMAHDQFHLYTIIRPGPYICAEWLTGGYPRWLLNKQPADIPGHWLRGGSPSYLAWCKHWYDAVCPIIAEQQVTRRKPGEGGTILFQIENEYDYDKDFDADARTAQLKSLYQDAVADGIEVPIFTCWTKECRASSDPLLSNVFDGCNLYPRANINDVDVKLTQLRKDQPNAPMMVPEMQGGWFSDVNDLLAEDQPNIDSQQERAVTLESLQNGATIMNYYMIFGGTNFGAWGSRNMTTTYDYHAPIREGGGTSPKYFAVQGMGEMLQNWGQELARTTPVTSTSDVPADVKIVVRKAQSGNLFVFCSRSLKSKPLTGSATLKLDDNRQIHLTYDLTNLNFVVARVTPDQSDVDASAWMPRFISTPDRPETAEPLVVDHIVQRIDAGDLDWQPVQPGENLIDRGLEEPRFVYYRATPTLTADQAAKLHTLKIQMLAVDGVVARVNGALVVIPQSKDHVAALPLANLLKAGQNKIEVLYDDQSQEKFDRRDFPGIKSGELEGTDTDAVSLDWSVADRIAGDAAGWWKDSSDDTGWSSRPSKKTPVGSPALATWYRAEFSLPSPTPGVWAPWKAHLTAAGDAYLYLNGHELGRYWDSGPQWDFYLPECWLKFGADQTNVLTLVMRPTDRGMALRGVTVLQYADQAERR